MPDKGGATLSDKRRRLIANRTEGWIIKHLPEFIDTLADLARGVWEEKTDGRSGETKIYQRIPDRQALEFLIEHGLGKVPQRHELTGEEGGPLEIVPWMPPISTASLPQLVEGETNANARGTSQAETEEGKEDQEDGKEVIDTNM